MLKLTTSCPWYLSEVRNASEMVIYLCFCSCPGSGEDPPEPPGSGEALLDLLDLEKTWGYWRKPGDTGDTGEDMEFLYQPMVNRR